MHKVTRPISGVLAVVRISSRIVTEMSALEKKLNSEDVVFPKIKKGQHFLRSTHNNTFSFLNRGPCSLSYFTSHTQDTRTNTNNYPVLRCKEVEVVHLAIYFLTINFVNPNPYNTIRNGEECSIKKKDIRETVSRLCESNAI